jgi:CRISPR-associated protein Cmr4
MMNLVYCYLLSPLHTGGATQEGNLLGIARESHTELPYVPSSTVRGKLRSITDGEARTRLFGPDLDEIKDTDGKLTQGNIWIGDGSVLWLPVPSLSHGVVWVSCPLLLKRWARLAGKVEPVPPVYSFSSGMGKVVYLKDAILKAVDLQAWASYQDWLPESKTDIERALVLPDQHCATLIQMSLWRQVKVKLDESKTVEGGFRYEEAIPPDTMMYFPWGATAQANGSAKGSQEEFKSLLTRNDLLQIGGQESLGRGFVQVRLAP